MTRRAVEAVIGRATLDEEFRNALFADPDSTLSSFTLTRSEQIALKSIDSESLEYFASSPGMMIAQSLLLQHYANEDPMLTT